VHFHTLALDGVFARSRAGRLVFHSANGPSDAEVAQVLATIRRRVERLLRRRGLQADADGTEGQASTEGTKGQRDKFAPP
jgi:hypothetical protein